MKRTSIQPRTGVHRGRVEASGTFFDFKTYSPQEAKTRILSAWESGARVYELEAGYLLRFASSRPLRAETALGALIVERAGYLVTTPLSEIEWRALEVELSALPGKTAPSRSAPSRSAALSVVLVREGHVVVADDAQLVEPSEWLSCQGWSLEPLEPLGQPAPIVLETPVAQFSARKALEVPESQELQRFLEMLNGGPNFKGQEPAGKKLRAWLASLFGGSIGSEEAQGAIGSTTRRDRLPSWLGFLSRLFGGKERGDWAEGDRLGAPPRQSFWSKVFPSQLFMFRFGASDDAPVLKEGEQFSSEFGLILPTLLWGGFFLYLVTHYGSQRSANIDWSVFVGGLLLAGFIAWILLVIARFFPTPGFMAASQTSSRSVVGGGEISFDLLILVLLCAPILLAWRAGNWVGVATLLVLAFAVALLSHWWRRRADPFGAASVSHGANTSTSPGAAEKLLKLALWLGERFGARSGGAGKKAGGAAAKAAAAKAAQANQKPSALNRWLWSTELARIMGARQARYMMRMMQMFESGDLNNALRHAVPLGLFGESSGNLALGTPKARQKLDFHHPRGGGRSTLPLPPQIQEQLTQLYRSAFNKLEAQARIDEAAFVLAELLDSPLEAVQFLEKHNRWKQAAELSEARELEPGLTVRLWWLAGNRQRAIVVAQRSGAFHEAIKRLEQEGEKSWEAATMLRLLWGQSRALAGDFAGAVNVVWSIVPRVPQAQGFVGAWIERGLESEGIAAAQMLAQQAFFLENLSSHTVDSWRERVEKLLADRDEEAIRLRLAFANGFSWRAPNPLAQVAARRLVRALARDVVHFPRWSSEIQASSKKLIDFAQDGPLRTDASALKFPTPPTNFHALRHRLELEFTPDDTGALEITDAAWLQDGRVLVALGESGARLLNREGRTIAAFDQPCHRLVTIGGGTGEGGTGGGVTTGDERAIGVALRGSPFREEGNNWGGNDLGGNDFGAHSFGLDATELSRRAEVARLCRFDLTRKECHFWGEAQIGQFTSHCHGTQWLVTSGDSIVAIDVTAAKPTALWNTGDAGYAECLAADDTSLAMLTHFQSANQRPRTEVWRFDLPSLILRERRLAPAELTEKLVEKLTEKPTEKLAERTVPKFIRPDATILLGQVGESPQSVANYDPETKLLRISSPLYDGEKLLQIESTKQWLFTLRSNQNGLVLRLLSRHDQAHVLRGKIELQGSQRARFRLTDSHLVIGDDRGRLIVVDLETGAVIRNLRLF